MTKSKLDEVIKDIAKLCGMKVLHGPVIVEGGQKNPGLTAFAVIDLSHISIHTFPESGEIYIDIFSCKEFDCKAIEHYVKKGFNIDENRVKISQVC